MARKVARWYQSGKPLGWSKDMGQAKRRQAALSSRRGNALAAGRALLALANVNSGRNGDEETHRKANADAQYFFRLYRQKKKK